LPMMTRNARVPWSLLRVRINFSRRRNSESRD
jgi:hypothetical protein